MKEFTVDKFFDIFFWAKDILDYEKSTSMGKWFFQSMTILLIPKLPNNQVYIW